MFSNEIDDARNLIADYGIGALIERGRKISNSLKERNFLDKIEEEYYIFGDFAELEDRQMQLLVAIAGYDEEYTRHKKLQLKTKKENIIKSMMFYGPIPII